MEGQVRQPLLLIDACVVINLYASQRFSEILSTIQEQAAIVETVQNESLYVRRSGTGGDAEEHEVIDLAEDLASGLIQVVTPTAAELALFVDLAADLDDGEAMTAALAIQRRCPIATDDRVAMRIIAGRAGVVTTPDLIQRWAADASVQAETVKQALIDIRERARFLPARSHPLKAWWDSYLNR